jgi:hypothetical protein
LGHLLEIDVGEAFLEIVKVWRWWFSSSNNAATAVGSWEVHERRDEFEQPRVDRSLVGHWGNIIDPHDTTWVHPDGKAYVPNEASVLRGEGSCPWLLDTEFKEGGLYDAWSDCLDV